MADQTTAAPAGASEQAPASAPTGPLNMAAAVSMWADLDRDPETPVEAAPENADGTESDGNPSGEAPDTGDGDERQSEETASEEGAEEPAGEAETEDDEPEVVIHGNTMLVLRDGTKVRASDARKAIGELREIREQLPALQAAQEQAAQYAARAAEIAQREQFVQQYAPVILQRMQAQIPPEPDLALLHNDPIQYMQDKELRERAIADFRSVANGLQTQQQQQQKQDEEARAAQIRDYVAQQRTALIAKIPDVADPEKGRAIYEGIVKDAGKYGISKEEVDGFHDHRVWHWLVDQSRKAAAYDKLVAQRPAATAKARTAPPVQAPGRRIPAGEAAQRALDDRVQKWRDSGNRKEDAIAIFAELQ